ncbi:MAG TPA: LptA/OstA family protein [Terriglobales bacterium]
MPIDPKLLRKLFAAGTVLAVLVACGFYLRGILKSRRYRPPVTATIAENISQVAHDFKMSKSDGQRTLFTIQAASFQQFKEGQRFELHDASIILYGRDGTRGDHISGSDFQYDKGTGDVVAKGEVQIDLEATSPAEKLPRGAVAGVSNVIHLTTSGLVFNENTGLAETKGVIEFKIPDGSGSAVGATYDSKANMLSLKSAVRIVTTGRQKATVTGNSATIVKNPQRIVVEKAKIDQSPRILTTDKLTLLLRNDNTVERILGSGNIHARREGPQGFDMAMPEGELVLDTSSQLRSGTLSGGVTFAGQGESAAGGQAGEVFLTFGEKGQLKKAHAQDAVKFNQGPPGKSQQVEAAAVDFFLRDGKILDKAVTGNGPAQIVVTQGVTKSTISSAQFEAHFNGQNRLSSVIGTPGARIVSTAPGQADRLTTSRQVTAAFNAKGELTSAEQTGDFHYQEGQREGFADRARYNPADESYILNGSPRLTDPEHALAADSIQISRKDSSVFAQGSVKSTYNQRAQAGGAMLASADPVHVTGSTMTASRTSGVARYTSARLWRGPDVVQAPTIIFDNPHRSLEAHRDPSHRVNSVFVQLDKNGKTTPVNVTSDRLSYVDAERRAVYNGNVLVTIEGSTISADNVEAFLVARGVPSQGQSGSQLDHIVAQGDIQIQQPDRKATGSQLVYTAQEEKFVLTGTPQKLPSIFDAERGEILGDSLTFFRHDGRVLVGNGESSHTLPQIKVQDASKK